METRSKVLYIGIGGKKRHGKDTVARLLLQRLFTPGWQGRSLRRAFADALREEVAAFLCDRLQGVPSWDANVEDRCTQIMDALTSDAPQEKEKFRLLLQWWGTEFRRNMVGEDYWIRALTDYVARWQRERHSAGPDIVVVPDVRMENEARFIHAQGGLLIKVVRSGMADADTHATETGLDTYVGWDAILPNCGTLEMLSGQVRIIREGLLEERLRGMKTHG